jgi:dihydroxyacid dehydratase/phosphogluconate dehydratase
MAEREQIRKPAPAKKDAEAAKAIIKRLLPQIPKRPEEVNPKLFLPLAALILACVIIAFWPERKFEPKAKTAQEIFVDECGAKMRLATDEISAFSMLWNGQGKNGPTNLLPEVFQLMTVTPRCRKAEFETRVNYVRLANGTNIAPAQLAEASGRKIVKLVELNLTPSKILTPAAFDNAIRTLHALGGSANAVIHLIALAGRVGIDLPLRRFDELSRDTPFLANVKPSGQYLMEDFFHAGGVPAVLRALAPLLHLVVPTVTGQTLGERLASDAPPYVDRSIIAARDQPVEPQGGLIALFGSLAPKGAILKRSAADPKLFEHEGRAVVFSSLDDLAARVDDPALDVAPQDVLVLQNAGPHAPACMPEAGYLPIPRKLARQGVKDMIRVSDARMSGTAFGTIVLHVTPDSASGGPLRLVRNGDRIRLSVKERRIDLLLDAAEMSNRIAATTCAQAQPERGYDKLYAKEILGADAGCDFAFLRPPAPAG